MTYISKQFSEAVALPDGTFATNTAELDMFLKRSGYAMAGDYSAAYLAQVRYQKQTAARQDLFNTFINNYKRSIWYGK